MTHPRWDKKDIPIEIRNITTGELIPFDHVNESLEVIGRFFKGDGCGNRRPYNLDSSRDVNDRACKDNK